MTRTITSILAAAALFLIAAPSVAAKEEFAIKEGDRVVFWGDSISDNAEYPRTIEQYVRGRYPHLNADFYNLAWGGDSTATLQRMERDVLPLDPTLVFIMLGMNDGGYAPYSDATMERYISGMDKLVALLRERTRARIILITTVPYETGVQTGEKGKALDTFYPEALRKMSDALIAWAKTQEIPVIDLNRMYGEAMASCKEADPALKLSGDGIHPNASGQALIAYCILKALGADGNILRLVIDAGSGSVLASENQTVSDFTMKADSFSFTRKVAAFPFLTRGGTLTIDLAPWHDSLNRDMIAVQNLTAPYYILALKGGDAPLGVFKREELEQGVNLSVAGIDLPEFETAAFIADCVAEKNRNRYRHWRGMLLKGVDSAYKFTPYLPETSEGLLLAAEADLIASFLTSDGLFCPEYTLQFIASETAVASSDSLFSSVLDLCAGEPNAVTGTWTAGGELRESADDLGRTYAFTYDYTGTWWAAFGLNLGDPGSGAPLDAGAFDAVQLSYKGLEDGHKLMVALASPGTTDDVRSKSIDVGGAVGNYTTALLPLSDFSNARFDPTKISAITFGITGAESGQGVVSVRSVRFVARK